MSLQFDAHLGGQVSQFLQNVEDFVPASVKDASQAEKLVALLDSEEKQIREHSLAFLAFANQNQANKDIARDMGLIQVFLKYLSPSKITESIGNAKHGSMGLMFLSNYSDVNKQAIFQLGGLDIVFDALKYITALFTDAAIKKEDLHSAITNLLNIIILASSLAPIRQVIGTVPFYIVLLSYLGYKYPENQETEYQIVEKALSAINNISMPKENKDNARVAGCIEGVMKLFSATKPQLVDSAIRMIYNMTIIDQNRETIRRTNGLEALVSLFSQKDEIKLMALKAISNMAVDRKTIEYVIQNQDQVLKPILDLFPLNNNEVIFDQVLTILQNLVSEDQLIESVSNTGILTKIIPSIKGMPLVNTQQQSILTKSTCIISALVTIEDVQQSAIENGVIAILVDLLQYKSVEIRREAARSLANATPYYDDVRGEVGKLGGVPLCLELLLSSDKEVVKQAARSLVNLARNTFNEETIFESKGLEHSIRLISQPEKDLKMLGTKLLVNLSLNEKARIAFCLKGGLQIVQDLLNSDDQELQLQGTKIVTNLAISGRNRKLINENQKELLPLVRKLLASPSSTADLKAQADVAINNLSFPYEKSYDGLDAVGIEEQLPAYLAESLYEHEEEEDEDEDKEEAERRRKEEEEELRLAAEAEIQERKRIMEEEMKRIEQRRKQEEERRAKEEEERKQKEEQERLKKIQEELERVRLEEEANRKAKEEEEKRKKEEQERLKKLEQQQLEQKELEKAQAAKEAYERELKAQKEEEERKIKEEEAKKKREEEEKRAKEEAERIKREEEERIQKEREAEERRIQREEEEKLKLMQAEIAAREEEVKRKKEEEEVRRKKEEEAKKLAEEQKRTQEAQDKASQEAAKAAQEAARAQKRNHIVQEIMQVEINYVRNLGLIVKKFLNPLGSAAASKRPILTQDKIKALFSNVETIHNFNSMLSDGISSRVKRWLADNKKDHLLIGDIFFKTTDFMTAYSAYINNYNNAIKTLKECKANNPPFAQFIKKVEADPELRDQELENLLINPVQQLPRYVMLIQDLIKNTNEDHPDYKQLLVALDKIKQVTSYVNERKRDAEDAMTMISIQQSIHGKLPANFLARKFVMEGTIQFGSSSGSFKDKDPVVFLFTDMLMMTIKHPSKPNEYKFRYSVQLTNSTVIEDFPRINNGFLVKAAQWWMFSCATPQEKQTWVTAIQKVIKSFPIPKY